VCEDCGRALGRQRLLAEPTARLCMPCQRRPHRTG
jgi:RNA polymerase-binding transcription factor DksA